MMMYRRTCLGISLILKTHTRKKESTQLKLSDETQMMTVSLFFKKNYYSLFSPGLDSASTPVHTYAILFMLILTAFMFLQNKDAPSCFDTSFSFPAGDGLGNQEKGEEICPSVSIFSVELP